MMKRFLPFIAIMAVLSLFSCKRENDNAYGPETTRGFYPLQKGRFVIYDVDSILYNDFTGTTTEHKSVVRYTVEDTFQDNYGRTSYQIDVMSKASDSDAFHTNDVFYVTPTPTGLEVVQNNLRFTKLVFPVANNTTWDGNSQIAIADQDLSWYANVDHLWDYKYSKVGQNYNNGLADYSNTAIVDETDQTLNDPIAMPTTYAERTYFREVYGFDVGLVYREMTRWTYDQNSSGNYAKKGFSMTMRAKEHN